MKGYRGASSETPVRGRFSCGPGSEPCSRLCRAESPRGTHCGICYIRQGITLISRRSHTTSASQVSFLVTLVASTFLMGSSFVAGKILIHQGFPPLSWSAGGSSLLRSRRSLLSSSTRGGLGAALLPARTSLREAGLVILIGLVQTAAVTGLLFWAMRSISASTAAILLFTNPIWVAVLGRLFLGEISTALGWPGSSSASSALHPPSVSAPTCWPSGKR
jgi:hypothetical protein